MWLGQKENRISGRFESTGFFESTKAIKIDDDDDQGMSLHLTKMQSQCLFYCQFGMFS